MPPLPLYLPFQLRFRSVNVFFSLTVLLQFLSLNFAFPLEQNSELPETRFSPLFSKHFHNLFQRLENISPIH
jgi:hypothetical protein